MSQRPGEGVTALDGLYEDVPMDRVWSSSSLSQTGYIISQQSVLNSVHVLCRKLGNKFEVFVLNRVCIFGIFYVLDRVRVSNPQRLTYTKTLVEYSPGPG